MTIIHFTPDPEGGNRLVRRDGSPGPGEDLIRIVISADLIHTISGLSPAGYLLYEFDEHGRLVIVPSPDSDEPYRTYNQWMYVELTTQPEPAGGRTIRVV